MDNPGYQAFVISRINPDLDAPDKLAMCALGLAGESGEYADQIKKHLFHSHELDVTAALKELGDILWYVTASAHLLGSNLQEVLDMNRAKLNIRYPDGFTVANSLARVDEALRPQAPGPAHGPLRWLRDWWNNI